jgi:hypothetical protein
MARGIGLLLYTVAVVIALGSSLRLQTNRQRLARPDDRIWTNLECVVVP